MNDAAKLTLSQVLAFIHTASKEDRVHINRALSSAREEDIYDAKREFRVGDRVMFKVNKRGYPRVVRGVITQKNVKTFHVRPNDGGRDWKVTASLVEKDDQPAAATAG